MRGHDDHLSIGDRVAYWRKRRGLTQSVLAGLVGRTESWLRQIEAGRHDLDRLSMIRELAAVLGVGIGDLIGTPILLEWKTSAERTSIPALRAALTDHSRYLPAEVGGDIAGIDLDQLSVRIHTAWEDYQGSRYTRLTLDLPALITDTTAAARHLLGDAQRRAQRQAATTHQLCGVYLPKLGETDLALLAAGKGLELAQLSGDLATIAALYRIVAYDLASLGEHGQAVALASTAIDQLAAGLTRAEATGLDLSAYGMLHLVAGRAAAQFDNRGQSDKHLNAAERVASRLGGDANHGWTGFGPTNVTIHRVACAVELGDLVRAVELGPSLDTSGLPVERRGRHAIESARALSGVGRSSDAIELLVSAEQYATEQIRHHHQAREVVRRAVRLRNPTVAAMGLATRMGIAEL